MEAPGPPRLFRVFLSTYCLGARSLERFSGFSHQPVSVVEIRYSHLVNSEVRGRKWEVRFALKTGHGQPGPSGLKSANINSATPDSATFALATAADTAMALKPYPEWTLRLGASPQKRMVASWSGSCMDPTEHKVAARASRPTVGSPRINYAEPRTTKERRVVVNT